MRFLQTTAIVLRYYYLIRGSLTRFVPLFVWVTIDMLLWGFMSRYLNSVSSTGFNFVPALLGAVLLWDFLTRVMHGVTTVFFEDVWSRNFLNVFATPLRISEYLGGLVLASIGTSAIGLVIMVLVATMLFGLPVVAYGASAGPFLLLLFVFGIALGIAGTAMVLVLGPAAEWFVWPIPAVLAPFAGVYYPISTLPSWMQAVERILPASYVFEGVRGIVAGKGSDAGGLLVGGVLSVVYLLIACFVFSRVYRRAVRTGALARYTAETVS